MTLVEPFSKGIGPALATLRKRAGLTQSALARKLQMSQPRLSLAEKSGTPAPARLIEQYLVACGFDVFDLALAFLAPDTGKEERAELALRMYGFEALPEHVRSLALESLQVHWETLDTLLHPADGDEFEDL